MSSRNELLIIKKIDLETIQYITVHYTTEWQTQS
jgi:hypothetical protein